MRFFRRRSLEGRPAHAAAVRFVLGTVFWAIIQLASGHSWSRAVTSGLFFGAVMATWFYLYERHTRSRE